MFLCTGNSCRSQMAEGFARHLLSGCEVYSAGLEPKGVHPLAIKVMAEAGIDISKQQSKPLDPELLNSMDVVVTLCGDAEERCVAVPGTVKKFHWPLPDPARAVGTEEQVMEVFRSVRDQIRERTLELGQTLGYVKD
ncbi:MAG: arsenate reductase (thioredoxin) [Bacillota bacterium]